MNHKPDNINKFLNVLRSPLKILGLVSIVLLLAGIVTAWTYTNPPRVDCFDNGTCVNGNTKWNETSYTAESFYATSNVTAGYYNTTDGRELQNGGCSAAYCIRYNPTDGMTVEAINGTDGSKISGAVAHTIINNAIAANPTRAYKAKIIIIGNYSLSSNINPATNTTLDITEAKLTFANNANTDVIKNTTGLNNFDLVGGLIDVNGANQISGGRGIQLQNASNINIINTEIINSRLQAVFIAQEGYNNKIVVDGVKAKNGSTNISSNNEIFVGGSWITVKNTISEDGWDGGVVVASAEVNGNASSTLNEILLENNRANNTAVGIYIGNNGQRITIRDCFINNTKNNAAIPGYGIRIMNTSRGTAAASNITIDGCNIGNTASHGIYSTDNASDMKIRNSLINPTGANSIGISLYGYGSQNIELSGNTIYRSGAHNIYLEGIDNIKAHDNFLYSPNQGGAGGSGIRGVNITNLSAHDNTILDSTGVMQYPIHVTGIESARNKVYNNDVTPGTSGSIVGVNVVRDNYGVAPYNWGSYAGTGTNISAFGAGDTFYNSTTGKKSWCVATAAGTASWTFLGNGTGYC